MDRADCGASPITWLQYALHSPKPFGGRCRPHPQRAHAENGRLRSWWWVLWAGSDPNDQFDQMAAAKECRMLCSRPSKTRK